MTTLAYARWEFWRNIRIAEAAVFTLALPVGLYLMFGAMTGAGDLTVGDGNVKAYTMTSMATYGSVIAMTSVAGFAAAERARGWTRQLALTRLSHQGYIIGKVLVGLAMAALAVALVIIAGLLTGAEFATVWHWAATIGLILIGTLPFALYGLAAALLFRTEGAVGVASGLLVVLGFLGNVFIPLSGGLLAFARFTPMYGAVSLARWPQLEGELVAMDGTSGSDPLWLVLLNLAVWTSIFFALCMIGARRSTGRS